MLSWLFGGTPRRRIFKFWDGSRYRWVDPIAVHRDLEQAGGPDWGETFGRAVATVPLLGEPAMIAALGAGREDAARSVASWTREAFGVRPFDGNGKRPVGLTDAESMELLVRFLDYCRSLNEAVRPFPKPSPSESPSPAMA